MGDDKCARSSPNHSPYPISHLTFALVPPIPNPQSPIRNYLVPITPTSHKLISGMYVINSNAITCNPMNTRTDRAI